LHLEIRLQQWEIPPVTTATVDERKRVRLPTAAPGQVFIVEPNKDGSRIVLSKVAKLAPRRRRANARFEKHGRYTVLVTDGPTITSEDVKRALEEFS
jgi:hypothetical protein